MGFGRVFLASLAEAGFAIELDGKKERRVELRSTSPCCQYRHDIHRYTIALCCLRLLKT